MVGSCWASASSTTGQTFTIRHVAALARPNETLHPGMQSDRTLEEVDLPPQAIVALLRPITK
jgi:hypothetical protein